MFSVSHAFDIIYLRGCSFDGSRGRAGYTVQYVRRGEEEFSTDADRSVTFACAFLAPTGNTFLCTLSLRMILLLSPGASSPSPLAVHPSEPPPQPPPSVCTRKRRTIANRKGLTASVGGGFAGPTLSNGYYAKPRRRPWSRTHIRTRGYTYTMCIGCVYIYIYNNTETVAKTRPNHTSCDYAHVYSIRIYV